MLIVHLFVSYAHVNLCHFFASSWCRGLAAASACGSSLTFLFTFLHYFGELIAIGMRQFMVGETVDSILVKEDRFEIAFLFHSICLISQCCFCQHIMIPYTLNIYDFLLELRFLSWKNSAST